MLYISRILRRGPPTEGPRSSKRWTLVLPIIFLLLVHSTKKIPEEWNPHNFLSQTNINFTKQSACRRYAIVKGRKEGLGHRISQIAIGIVYALEKNASLVIDRTQFTSEGSHGSYPWAIDTFGLRSLIDISDLNISAMSVIKEPLWHVSETDTMECNVLFETCDECCSALNRTNLSQQTYCYNTKHWAFAISRPYFMRLRQTLDFETHRILQRCRQRGKVDAVWHVRVGDIVLTDSTKKVYIDTVMNTIATLFNVSVQFYVISEGDTKAFEFHQDFARHKVIFLDSLSAEESLKMMIQSSILITSGSSFSAIAALVKDNTSIAFQSPPKEGSTGIYELYEHAVLDAKGTVTHPNEVQLKIRAQRIVRNLHQNA